MKSTEIAGIPDSQQPVRDAEAPGLRLMAFLSAHQAEIMAREKDNERYAYLYGFESYWVAFEHSAYQLCRLFPRSDTSIIRFVTYPFPVVMASITDTELWRLLPPPYPESRRTGPPGADGGKALVRTLPGMAPDRSGRTDIGIRTFIRTYGFDRSVRIR